MSICYLGGDPDDADGDLDPLEHKDDDEEENDDGSEDDPRGDGEGLSIAHGRLVPGVSPVGIIGPVARLDDEPGGPEREKAPAERDGEPHNDGGSDEHDHHVDDHQT